MTDNTITITMDDVLGPDGLEGAWDGMVRGLVDRAESRFLHSDAGRSFHAAAVEAINKAVEERIAEKVAELMERPIQQTDNYGSPKGEPKTFTQMIGDAVEGAMSQPVDIYGKPRVGLRQSGDKTLFEYALQRVALEGLQNAVVAEAKKVNTQAKDAVSKEIAKAVAKTIKA